MARRTVQALITIVCLVVGMAAGLVTSTLVYRSPPVTAPTDFSSSRLHAIALALKQVSLPPDATFSVDKAMAHVTYLASTIGIREEGTPGEEQASEYIRSRLVENGFTPSVQVVPIETTGRVTRNIIARLSGTVEPERTIVIGAHMDCKGGPGANDNATGCGILLELARVFKNNNKQIPSIEFVFFGGEEIARGGTSNEHHWGSRFFVSSLSAAEKNSLAGMLSVDMVGAGPDFHCRNIGYAPQALRDMVLELGARSGMTYLQDTSSAGMSDQEPFEKAGIPAVWLEYKDFAAYHTAGDTTSMVDTSHVNNVGVLLQEFFEKYLTPEKLSQLHPRV